MGKTIGLDLGSSTTVICMQDQNENGIKSAPTVIAFEKKTKRVLALGSDAKKMIGRAPAQITVSTPISGGVVTDVENTTLFVTELLENLNVPSVFSHTEMVVTIPGGANKNEETALETAILDANISTFDLVEAPVAIALGAGMPVDLTNSITVVDVGAGQASASIISHGGVVVSSTTKYAGDEMTLAIADYVANTHGIIIGELTAEALKIKLATLNPSSPQKSMRICGKKKATKDNANSRVTRSATITSHELIPVLAPIANVIIATIKKTMQGIPPDISADISDFGILLSGGCAAMDGLAEYIEKAMRVRVFTTKTPSLDAAKGLLRIINGGRAYKNFVKK